MSVESTNRPPILRSFLESDLFDYHLLSSPELITEMLGDDRSMAVFMRLLTFNRDFQNQPKLFKAHTEVLKGNADRALMPLYQAAAVHFKKASEAFTKTHSVNRLSNDEREALNAEVLTTRKQAEEEASQALRHAVGGRNPFLLQELINIHAPFDGTYDYFHAAKEAAENGDLLLLQKLSNHVSLGCLKKVFEIALEKGHAPIIVWLPNQLISSYCLLDVAFKTPYWRRIVPCVLPKISAVAMQNALFECAKILIKLPVEKMEFFIEQTKAKTLIEPKQWGVVLAKSSAKTETVVFILVAGFSISFDDLEDVEMMSIFYHVLEYREIRERLAPQVLTKIPPNHMKKVLIGCAERLMAIKDWPDIDFFLHCTQARELLKRDDWGKILGGAQRPSRTQVEFIEGLGRNQIPFSLNNMSAKEIGLCLATAFTSLNWAESTQLILINIPPDKMKKVFTFSARVLVRLDILMLKRFFAHTDAKALLSENEWREILEDPAGLAAGVFFFVMDPQSQIPISSDTLYRFMSYFVDCEQWDCVEHLLSLKQVQEDPDFLTKASDNKARIDRDSDEYLKRLDKYFHRFQNRDLFFEPRVRTMIQASLRLSCDNILATFIVSPGAMQAHHLGEYVVPTHLLVQISEKCLQTEHRGLKESKQKVDKEILRRMPLWKRISSYLKPKTPPVQRNQ